MRKTTKSVVTHTHRTPPPPPTQPQPTAKPTHVPRTKAPKTPAPPTSAPAGPVSTPAPKPKQTAQPPVKPISTLPPDYHADTSAPSTGTIPGSSGGGGGVVVIVILVVVAILAGMPSFPPTLGRAQKYNVLVVFATNFSPLLQSLYSIYMTPHPQSPNHRCDLLREEGWTSRKADAQHLSHTLPPGGNGMHWMCRNGAVEGRC